MPFQKLRLLDHFFPSIILAVSSASKRSLLHSYHQILSKYTKEQHRHILLISFSKVQQKKSIHKCSHAHNNQVTHTKKQAGSLFFWFLCQV